MSTSADNLPTIYLTSNSVKRLNPLDADNHVFVLKVVEAISERIASGQPARQDGIHGQVSTGVQVAIGVAVASSVLLALSAMGVIDDPISISASSASTTKVSEEMAPK